MNRTTRIALTGGLALAALTVGGAALADQHVASDPVGRSVAVQNPAPGSPDQRDYPWDGGRRGPSGDDDTPTPSAGEL